MKDIAQEKDYSIYIPLVEFMLSRPRCVATRGDIPENLVPLLDCAERDGVVFRVVNLDTYSLIVRWAA